MIKNLKFWRLWARYLLSTTIVLSVTFIVLTFLFESEALAGVPGEAWTLMGILGGGISTALIILARAIAKNPTDSNTVDDDTD